MPTTRDAGHGHYLAAAPAEGVLRARLGEIDLQTLAYGETHRPFGVRISLHPAGHVLGSAQVRLEHAGRVWVASGDYFVAGRTTRETTPPARRSSRCAAHCFITESTFGLPIYRWQPQREVFADIDDWWRGNAEAGRASLLMGYSFGKAQRILAGVDAAHRADRRARRRRAAQPRLPRGRRRAAADAAGRRRHRARALSARARHRAAVGAELAVDAPLRRLQRCLRQRLDAVARRAPAARASTAASC